MVRALKILFNRINFCELVLRLRLNAEQSHIVNFVQKGHNVLVTGQAGVGKSEVVKFIIHSLRAVEKNVGVVCASGIATQVSCLSRQMEIILMYFIVSWVT